MGSKKKKKEKRSRGSGGEESSDHESGKRLKRTNGGEAGKKNTDKDISRLQKLISEIRSSLTLKVEKRISKRPRLASGATLDGWTPLHEAARAGNFQVSVLLLRRGADIESQDNEGRTALFIACQEKFWDLAEMLVDRGASWIKSKSGESPLSLGLQDWLLSKSSEQKRKALHMQQKEEERQKRDEKIEEERAWAEKMMDETYFEHLEGWELSGRGQEGLGGLGDEGFYFEEVNDDLEDDDWWEELGRKLRDRHRGFSSTSFKQQPEPEQPQPRWSGPQDGERMAWEHKTGGHHQERGFVYAGGATARTGADELTEEKREERAMLHAAAWEAFISKCKEADELRYEEFPWPVVPTGGDLAAEALMLPPHQASDAIVKKKAVREALRRWHPDKFMQKFSALMYTDDSERIFAKVKQISQALTALV